MHSTYVTNGFSHIDSRTANIERALVDLDPLLRTYATTWSDTRVSDLREILKKGARLAFTLFGEPCVWQFDWEEENLQAAEMATFEVVEEDPEDDILWKDGRKMNFGRSAHSAARNVFRVVMWPSLLRVINSEGQKVKEEEMEITYKKYLSNFLFSR